MNDSMDGWLWIEKGDEVTGYRLPRFSGPFLVCMSYADGLKWTMFDRVTNRQGIDVSKCSFLPWMVPMIVPWVGSSVTTEVLMPKHQIQETAIQFFSSCSFVEEARRGGGCSAKMDAVWRWASLWSFVFVALAHFRPLPRIPHPLRLRHRRIINTLLKVNNARRNMILEHVHMHPLILNIAIVEHRHIRFGI